MRELTDHVAPGADSSLKIAVTDEPGLGGANHRYEITGMNLFFNPSSRAVDGLGALYQIILFQNGPVHEADVNGITQEVLLAIVADRLRCFQAGPFPCLANAMALKHVEEALTILHSRTTERLQRGVEGLLKA